MSTTPIIGSLTIPGVTFTPDGASLPTPPSTPITPSTTLTPTDTTTLPRTPIASTDLLTMDPATLAKIGNSVNPWLQGKRPFGPSYPGYVPASQLTVAPNSAAIIAALVAGDSLDRFQIDATVPWNVSTSALTPISGTLQVPDESDKTLFPSTNVTVEPPSDQHLLVWHIPTMFLFEAEGWNNVNPYAAACFDALSATPYHPFQYTTADAAGLSILAHLCKGQDLVNKTANYPFRFTMPEALNAEACMLPGSHYTNSTTDTTTHLAFASRLTLDPTYDYSAHSAMGQYFCQCLINMGLILADNGSPGFISCDTDKVFSQTFTRPDGTQEYLNDVAHSIPLDRMRVMAPPMGGINTAAAPLTGPAPTLSIANQVATITGAEAAYIEQGYPIPLVEGAATLTVAKGAIVHAYNRFQNSEVTATA